MSVRPEFQISNHSPPGHDALSSDGQGFAITSLILKSDVTGDVDALFTVPGVGLLVEIQSLVALDESSSRLKPDDEEFQDAWSITFPEESSRVMKSKVLVS